MSRLVLIAALAYAVSGQGQNPFVLCGDDVFCNTVNGECIETPGSPGTISTFECVCNPGWGSPSDQPGRCDQKIDECVLDMPCNGPEGSWFCVNEDPPIRYRCGCNEGWLPILPANVTEPGVSPEDRPEDCVDINECQNAVLCPQKATCVNLPGSYDCECPGSQVFAGGACVEAPSAAPSPMPSSEPTRTMTPTTPSAAFEPSMIVASIIGLVTFAAT